MSMPTSRSSTRASRSTRTSTSPVATTARPPTARPGATRTSTAPTSPAPSARIDNGFGVVGVAPGARVWGVKILNDDGYGLLSWYVCGLDWVLAQKDPNDPTRPLFEAVNMSVTKAGSDDHNCGYTTKDVLHRAICRVVAGGITVVAAAANDTTTPAEHPGELRRGDHGLRSRRHGRQARRPRRQRCFSWGGYDKDDTFADFSNYGADVDIIAPGKCIRSTIPGALRVPVGHLDGRPRRRRRRRALQGEPPEGDAGRGQGGAPLSRQPELEDLDRPGLDPRAAPRRLADLGARDVRADAGARRRRNGRGAARPHPRAGQIARSETFFERVTLESRRCPTAGPAHRRPTPSAGPPTRAASAVTPPAGHAPGTTRSAYEAPTRAGADETIVR